MNKVNSKILEKLSEVVEETLNKDECLANKEEVENMVDIVLSSIEDKKYFKRLA